MKFLLVAVVLTLLLLYPLLLSLLFFLSFFSSDHVISARYLAIAVSNQILPPILSLPVAQLALQSRSLAAPFSVNSPSAAHFLSASQQFIDSRGCITDLEAIRALANEIKPVFHGQSFSSPFLDTRSPLPYPYSPASIAFPSRCYSSSSLSRFFSSSIASFQQEKEMNRSSSPLVPVKAALVVLVGNRSDDQIALIQSLSLFHSRLNLALGTDYKALIVYEQNEWKDVSNDLIGPLQTAMNTLFVERPLKLLFVSHSFSLPADFDPATHRQGQLASKRSPFGYQNMCRFWFRHVFSLPVIRELDFFLRLDSDSSLESDFAVDPFVYMRDHSMNYAYLHAAPDDTRWTRRLWPFVANFTAMTNHSLSHRVGFQSLRFPNKETLVYLDENDADFLNEERTPHVPQFYNNFEILDVRFFAEHREVLDFTRHVDETEPYGMLTYRWGDAPLRYLTLALFSSEEKVLLLNLNYKHSGWLIWKRIPARPFSWLSLGWNT